jgi:hypothetical protein
MSNLEQAKSALVSSLRQLSARLAAAGAESELGGIIESGDDDVIIRAGEDVLGAMSLGASECPLSAKKALAGATRAHIEWSIAFVEENGVDAYLKYRRPGLDQSRIDDAMSTGKFGVDNPAIRKIMGHIENMRSEEPSE